MPAMSLSVTRASDETGKKPIINKLRRSITVLLPLVLILVCAMCSNSGEPIVRKRAYSCDSDPCIKWTSTFTYDPTSGTTEVVVEGENLCTSTPVTPDKIVVQLYEKQGNAMVKTGTQTASGGTLTIDTPETTDTACVTSSSGRSIGSGCVSL